jgi:hypothetical protein
MEEQLVKTSTFHSARLAPGPRETERPKTEMSQSELVNSPELEFAIGTCEPSRVKPDIVSFAPARVGG